MVTSHGVLHGGEGGGEGALLELELLVSTVSVPDPKPTPAQIGFSIAC